MEEEEEEEGEEEVVVDGGREAGGGAGAALMVVETTVGRKGARSGLRGASGRGRPCGGAEAEKPLRQQTLLTRSCWLGRLRVARLGCPPGRCF